MHEGSVTVARSVRLDSVCVELVRQNACGPFHRTHQLALPALTYLPPTCREPVRGCFGEPASHRDYQSLGMAVMIPQTVPLHIVSPGFAARDMLVCHFAPDAFEAISGLRGDASDPALRACVDVRGGAVLEVLGRLLKEMDGEDRSGETIVAGYSLVLLGELERYFDRAALEDARPTGVLAPWQLGKIDDRVADPERPPPDVAELAQLCGVGRRHLMRCFKQARGMTVIDYVERGTFARAARLLRDTDLPLKAIAARLGYAQAASFTAAFRRHFGETPRAYRSQALGGRTAAARDRGVAA